MKRFKNMHWLSKTALAILLQVAVFGGEAAAARATVAVAGNFVIPARALSERFQAVTAHEIRLINGSTGGLFAQIVHGAPVDVFLAADRERPQALIDRGLGVAGSKFTYAVGRLVLWGRKFRIRHGDGAAALRAGGIGRLAVANPKLAPYGVAAQTVLRRLGVLESFADRLVYGQNIAQTFQFVATGNAPLGLVALSQMKQRKGGRFWTVPARLHDPIRQDALLLRRGGGNPAAIAFLAFLRGDAARPILKSFGYGDAR